VAKRKKRYYVFPNYPSLLKEKIHMTTLQAGDPAPNFSAPDQNENRVKLSDFKNRKLFIFFYPKANTSG